MYSFLFHVKFKGVIKVLGTSFCLRLVHLSVRISVHLNSSYTGSGVEEDVKNTENGTLDEYDRIAISDFIYAAKEVCGPIAYNGKGVTAAWPRIAKPAKMKKYPNHTMMGEL